MQLNEKTRMILENIPKGQAPMEDGILPLVNAVNELPGITTVASCEGHQNQYPYVILSVDSTPQAMEGICFITHALKSYHWRAIVCPIGSVGDLSLRFLLVPAMAVKEAVPDQPALATRASDPAMVEATQLHIPDIAGRLAYIRKSSRFIP